MGKRLTQKLVSPLPASHAHPTSLPRPPLLSWIACQCPPQPVPPPSLTYTEAKGCFQKMLIRVCHHLAYNLPWLPTACSKMAKARGRAGALHHPVPIWFPTASPELPPPHKLLQVSKYSVSGVSPRPTGRFFSR